MGFKYNSARSNYSKMSILTQLHKLHIVLNNDGIPYDGHIVTRHKKSTGSAAVLKISKRSFRCFLL